MRICYVSSDHEAIHNYRFYEKFMESGYDVHVVSLTKIPNKVDGITYHEIPLNHSNFLYIKHKLYYFKKFPWLIKTTRYLNVILKDIKPDILHGGWVQLDGAICAITDFHPFLLMPWGSDILIEPYNSALSYKLTQFTVNRADMITCDSQYVKGKIIELTGYHKDKIFVFPWGVDLDNFNSNVDGSEIRANLKWEDKKILIMTRNFASVYGIEYFIRSIPEIVKEYPDTRVILCGDGPLKNTLKQLVNGHKLSEFIHFTGKVPNEDLPRYLAAADIYVSSSLSDGTSLSLLEAMAIGLPVVVTDNPSIREWIKDGINGLIVQKKNPKTLSKKIIEILQDEKLQKRFGRENLKIAIEKANWNKNFKKLESIYEKLEGD